MSKTNSITDNALVMIIIAILLPPLAVGLKRGVGVSLLIGFVLFMMFYIPGLIYALWTVIRD